MWGHESPEHYCPIILGANRIWALVSVGTIATDAYIYIILICHLLGLLNPATFNS